MAVHERHCTMNPNRICRVCKTLLDQEPTPLSELVSICRKVDMTPDSLGGINIPKSLHLQLMAASKECPACEMAALRQSGIPCPSVPGFDFTEQMQAIWRDINEAKVEACNYGY